jgi:hypothetical protein
MREIAVKFTKDQQQIIDYLKEQISAGKMYFKAKHIGKDLNLSSRVVGTNLIKILKKERALKILPYADNGTATTWKIEIMRKIRGN